MNAVPLIEYDRGRAPRCAPSTTTSCATRDTDWINNFWKALANDPPTLRRTWESIKEVMAPGALDPLTKELIYLAVSVTNGCAYCTASHGAAAKRLGMTKAMFGELMAVVGMANETNSLADGYRVPVDESFRKSVLMLAHAAGAAPNRARHADLQGPLEIRRRSQMDNTVRSQRPKTSATSPGSSTSISRSRTRGWRASSICRGSA